MAVIMAIAAATVWIGLNRRYKAPSPMRCLPSQTALVARLGDRQAIGDAATGQAGAEVDGILGGEETRRIAIRIDSLFGPAVISDPVLRRRDLYVSFAIGPDGSVRQLSASFKLNNRMEWHKAMSALRDREGVEVSDTAISGHGLFLLRQADYDEPLFMAAGGGCLFASTTPDLLMSFGRDSVTPLCDDVCFAQIERTVSATADASVFINGREMAKAGQSIIGGTVAGVMKTEGAGADWMAFDIGLADDGISADGFAVAQRPSLFMLTSKENSSSLGLARRVPNSVARFFRIGGGRRGISSPSFSDFLCQDASGSAYRSAQSDLYSQTGVDIEDLLSQVFDSELALCSYGGADSAQAGKGTFLVADTHGGTKAHALITQALTALHGGAQPMVIGEIQPGAAAVPAGVVSQRADAEQISAISIPVYGGFEKGDNTFFLDVLLGQRVPGRLFFRYEDALVFADDMPTLRKVLADYVTGNTMEGDPEFDSLMTHFGNDCSTFTYETQPARSPFDVVCHQMTRTGNLPYISIFAHLSPQTEEESAGVAENAWSTRVDSIVGGRLWGVANHYTKLTECLTQDAGNKVCLIGADGMLLWRRPIDGAIVGDVSQVDFYGNGKLQYLLTTDKSVYIIDRLGNDVGPFPVKLPSASVSGASHAHYTDGSPMRIFVGCEGGPALFGPDGKGVEGWSAKKPEGLMLSAPRHLICAGKDYIVYNDKYAYYYVDRRGGKRLSTQPLAPGLRSQMTVSADGMSFITASSDGNVVAIDGNTGAISQLKLDSVGGEFIACRLSADSYIVAGTSHAYIADISGQAPKLRAAWRTGLQSVSQLKVLDGMILAYDAKESLAHVYSAIDGGEIPVSPFRARGSVAIGKGVDGLVAFTLGETGDIVQVNLTKGKK